MALPDDVDIGAFMRAVQQFFADVHALADERQPTRMSAAIRAHLGDDLGTLPVLDQTFPAPDHPNVQLALDELFARSATPPQLLGLPVDVLHWSGFGLGGLAVPTQRTPFDVVAPQYVNVPVDVDRTMPCLSLGVHLFEHRGGPVALLLSVGDPHRGSESNGIKIEVMARSRDAAVAVLEDLGALALERNVYRGKVLGYTFGMWGGFGLEFRSVPAVTRDDLVLPEADLDAIERHAVGIGERASRLRAAGRHVKRGLLLHGPPGTGKTMTVAYLCTRMPARTTFILSGQAGPALGQATAMARALQPSMVVIEDVDLVAADRTSAYAAHDGAPLLFQLLNEMDGLAEDADVLFVLTTNRADLLEPALAERPGRVDQAVHVGLPDASCRARLLHRYLRGLGDDLVDDDLVDLVDRTDGASAAFVKELTRRAALLALDEAPDAPPRVTHAHLVATLGDLDDERGTLGRLLGRAAYDAPRKGTP